jgi:hypothetical protein
MSNIFHPLLDVSFKPIRGNNRVEGVEVANIVPSEKKSRNENRELYFHLNKPGDGEEIYARILFTKKKSVGDVAGAILTHYTLPDCIFMYLQFGEAMLEITMIRREKIEFANCARQPLPVHEFLMHFSRLLCFLYRAACNCKCSTRRIPEC